MELKNKKINFLGDSITEGCGSSNLSKCYVSLVAQKTGAVCRNYGIGGTRIAKQHVPSDPKWDQDFCSRVLEMESDADIVCVFGGTNDFGHGDAPIGEFADRTVDTFYGALHTLYISLIEKYPHSHIVIFTPLHRCNEDNPKGDGNKAPTLPLKGYVDVIREVAEYYSLPVLDLFKESGLQPKVPVIKETYMPDGLHPCDAGYEVLSEKIINFLKNL